MNEKVDSLLLLHTMTIAHMFLQDSTALDVLSLWAYYRIDL